MFIFWKLSKMHLGSSVTKPAAFLFLGVVALVVVALIGHRQLHRNYFYHSDTSARLAARRHLHKAVEDILLGNFSGINIRDYLKELTKNMHVAGTVQNEQVAWFIKNTWRDQGLQNVHLVEYQDVLLSYPDYKTPNSVEILDDSGKVLFKSLGQSKVLIPSEQSDPGATITFNAYSSSGTATGQPVYANFGTVEDFQLLDSLNINLTGKIVLIRYGQIWRGDKVYEAQKRGAIGVLLFSDPQQFAMDGTTQSNLYPNTVWMAGFAAQRGTLIRSSGDPFTPMYPALSYSVKQFDESELKSHGIIPSIPVHPIGYNDAWHILNQLDGPVVPQGWRGSLNCTYRYGPGFKERNLKIKLTVRTKNHKRDIQNVIGYIEGSVEPDRYVIVGNHYDAWVYGAVDPNSATATMLEMSRVFMTAINETGWRPRRTIVFCAWDAEEYGLIGSTEWVEQFATILEHRALAYLNVDLIQGNETLTMDGNPSLIRAAVNSAKHIPNPRYDEVEKDRVSVYDTWFHLEPGNMAFAHDFPNVLSPNEDSDHGSFFNYLGIPVASFCYYNRSGANSSYPLYHTLYETPYLVDKLMDPNEFKTHVATGQFWAHLTFTLANSLVVPLNVSDYAHYMETYINKLALNLTDRRLPSFGVAKQIADLRNVAKTFVVEAQQFHNVLSQMEEWSTNHVVVERLNSRLVQLERCFINPRGNPLKRTSRHVVFGVSAFGNSRKSEFSAVYDHYYLVKEAKSEKELHLAVRQLKLQISIVHYSLECAIQSLRKTVQ